MKTQMFNHHHATRFITLIALACLLTLLATAQPAHAAGVVSVCDEANLRAALTGGGTVTFTCSGTITLTSAIIISSNTTLDGAGQRVTISGNHAVGIFRVGGVTFTLQNLTLAEGKAEVAGAIDNFAGTLNVSNVTFTGNSSNNSGGAINNSGTATLTNATFSGNSTTSSVSLGGAISNFGSLTLSNVTITGNSAGWDGGGIFDSGSQLSLTNVIVSGNPSHKNFDVVCFHSGGDSAAGQNNIIASFRGSNCNIPHSTANPLLGTLGDYGGSTQTIPLLAGSPAINAGASASCPATDQRGYGRSGACDIGAFEYNGIPPFPTTSILDNFNRANGRLGSNWDGADNMGFYRIVNNRVDVIAGGPTVWSPTSFGVNQEAFVKLSAVDARSREQGLLLKVQTGRLPQTAGMAVVYDAVAHAVRVETLRVRPFDWNRYANQAATFANGDQLGAQVLANGTVKIYKNGTQIATVTLNADDKAFFNGKGGSIGLWAVGAHNAAFDDFGGGNTSQ